MIKCEGSGGEQMLDWFPDDKKTKEFPKGYPGAVVCLFCSYGVLIVKGSDHEAVSKAGFEGRAGRLRVHWVYNPNDPTKMRYVGNQIR